LVVSLAIASNGCVERTEECSILNGIAYRLAIWLCDGGIASVFLPCGSNAGPEFPHERAARLAGLFRQRDIYIRSVSVLTSYDDAS
jgi:hypothetical protein